MEKFNYFYPKKISKASGRSGMIYNVKEGSLVKIQVLSFLFFNVVDSLKFKDMDVIHVQWPIPNGFGALFLKKLYGMLSKVFYHMRHEKLRKKIHVTGFNRINERFSMEHVTMSYLTVYKELLSHNRKKRIII